MGGAGGSADAQAEDDASSPDAPNDSASPPVTTCQANLPCSQGLGPCRQGVTTCASPTTQPTCMDVGADDSRGGCTAPNVCIGGACAAPCASSVPCTDGIKPCRKGATTCASPGAPAACVDVGVDDARGGCAAGTVCGNGMCVPPCKAGVACTQGIGPCRKGATTCASPGAQAACMDSGADDARGGCSGGAVCRAGQCVTLKERNAACGGAAECASGTCVGGHCCNSGEKYCDGQCRAGSYCCNGSPCPVSNGSGACSGGSCERTGCNSGFKPQGANQCVDACAGVNCPACQACSNGQCVATDSKGGCTGCNRCSGGQCETRCTSSQHCEGTTCVNNCTPGPCPATSQCTRGTIDCANGGACKQSPANENGSCGSNGSCKSGSCVEKKDKGDECTGASQCASGFCVDGRCCESACSSKCQGCSTALTGQPNGSCRNVLGNKPDPRQQCADDVSKCATNKCDGSGGCQRYANGTQCKSPSCDGNFRIAAYVCDDERAMFDGIGCRAAGSMSSCPNGCNPSTGQCN